MEYALIISLVALVTITVMSQFGTNVNCTITAIRLRLSDRICASEFTRCNEPNRSFGQPGPGDLNGDGKYDGANLAEIGNKYDGSC